ncbi:MAG: cell division protein FtsQ/DivIB [Thermodesulfobacteriota bacterium]
MEEIAVIDQERFLRPRKKRETRGGEKFQNILRKTVRIAFQLLLLSFFFFIGYRVYVHLLEDPWFRVNEVEVEGNQKISRETVLSLIRLEGMPNLFTLKLKEVTKRLEGHPWIEQVKARKVFPNKIRIEIEERRPIAILQLEEPYYIDTKGVIFSQVEGEDTFDYPFLTGLTLRSLEKDPAEAKRLITKALEFLRMIHKEQAFPAEEISEIHMEKAFGLQCFTKAEGIELRMGWGQFGEKLRRLSIIWSDLKKRGVSVISIDCSDLKRMVVKKSPS